MKVIVVDFRELVRGWSRVSHGRGWKTRRRDIWTRKLVWTGGNDETITFQHLLPNGVETEQSPDLQDATL